MHRHQRRKFKKKRRNEFNWIWARWLWTL